MAFKLASGMAKNSDYDIAWRKAMAQLNSTIESFNRILTIRERNMDDGNIKRIVANGILNFKEAMMVMKWLSRWDSSRDRMTVLETSQGTDHLFIMQSTGEEFNRAIEEISRPYGARIKHVAPFLLVFVNVIKAGEFYEKLQSRAGVP